MKLLLDTCVIYPTVMRQMLLGAAKEGCFTPLWSPRILEEWARAARKLGPTGEAQARSEIALIRARWPKAEVKPAEGVQSRLWLPDEADIHVLAAAISGHADGIVTVNNKDFPRHTLSEEGLTRHTPDELLYGFWLDQPEAVESVGQNVLADANAMSDEVWDIRRLLKKARLPRIAKALAQA